MVQRRIVSVAPRVHSGRMRNDRGDAAITQPVSTHWEPCPSFSADAAASPVCTGCGWLEPEHRAAA